jgi:hypothetical protein
VYCNGKLLIQAAAAGSAATSYHLATVAHFAELVGKPWAEQEAALRDLGWTLEAMRKPATSPTPASNRANRRPVRPL